MQDESDKESQKSDKESMEEDIIQLNTLDEEFFINMNDKIKQIIDSLEKRELNQYAEEVQVLLTVCNKVRDEWLNNEQKTKDAISECEDMREQLKETLDNARVDKDAIEQLKYEIELAWRQTDAAQLREQAAQEKLCKMNEKLIELQNIVQKLSQKSDDFTSLGPEQKEMILKEREKLSTEIKELNRRLQQQRLHTNEVEKLNSDMEVKLKELHGVLDDNSTAILNEKKLVEHLTKQKSNLEEELKSVAEKLKTTTAQNESYVKSTVQLNLKILAQKANFERLNNQYNEVSSKLSKTQSELENLKYEKENLTTLLEQKCDLLKIKEEENLKLKNEFRNHSTIKDSFLKKFQLIEKDRITIEKDYTKLKNEFTNLEKEYKFVKQTVAELNTKLHQITSERDTLKNHLMAEKNQINNYEEEIRVLQQQIKSLNNDLNTQKLSEKKQLNNITKIKSEKDKNFERIKVLQDKVSTLQDEIHLRNVRITDLENSIVEYQNKISSIQSSLEEVRKEKKSIEENLVAGNDEIEDLKKKLTITHEITKTVRNNLKSKNAEIIKYQSNIDRLEKEHYQMKMEITNLHVIIQNNKCELKEKKEENNNLYKTLAENENRIGKMKKEIDQYIHEKNTLHSRLTKSDEEILLQKQEIETLKINLNRENSKYEKCLDDLRKMKIEIQNLESQRTLLQRNLENSIGMRTELVQLQRNLNQEMIKNRALENEAITPLNVHRWRNLAGKDPEKFDLINKIQILQKTILFQHLKYMEREEALNYSNRLYEILKEFMMKLPSYRVQEQLNRTQTELDRNKTKMKALLAELNAKDIDEKAKDSMVDELRTNLKSVRRQLNDERRKKQELLEERQIITKVQLQCLSAPLPYNTTKTVGSGFRLSLTG